MKCLTRTFKLAGSVLFCILLASCEGILPVSCSACKSMSSRPYLQSSSLQAEEEGRQQERTHHLCRCSRSGHCKGRAVGGGGVSERLTQILPPERQDALWSSAVRTPWHWKDTSGSVLLLSITVWQRFRVAGNPRSSSFETS